MSRETQDPYDRNFLRTVIPMLHRWRFNSERMPTCKNPSCELDLTVTATTRQKYPEPGTQSLKLEVAPGIRVAVDEVPVEVVIVAVDEVVWVAWSCQGFQTLDRSAATRKSSM